MLLRLYGSSFAILLALLLASPMTSEADRGWERHEVTGPFRVEHPRFAHPRMVEPKCSGGPVVTRDANGAVSGIRAGDEQFSFFVHRGKRERVLIFFDGGGACWESNTCLLSAFFPPPGRPTYTQEIPQNFEPFRGGIMHLDNPANPFHDWTTVFIPYCTGDVHWGSSEAVYTSPNGLPLPAVWPIHHRGFDNFLAVLDWIRNNLDIHRTSQKPQVAVAGSSAGAYGALATFPFIQEILPNQARTYLLLDAGNGVVNDPFVMDALKEQWAVGPNLATWIHGISASILNRPHAAQTLEVTLVSSIAQAYPHTRIAQYTTAWDAVQTQFLNIMEEIDQPALWSDPDTLMPRFCEWSARAHLQTYVSALARNYRFYIGAGSNHTVFPGLPLPGFGNIYAEDSALGIPLVDWVEAMLDKKGTADSGVGWNNVQCAFRHCEPPFPLRLCRE